jgi:predicted dehydrogenase
MSRISRRSLLKLGAAGVALPVFARNLLSAPPSQRVRHASFGAAGMAGGDLVTLSGHPNVDVVCVAEVDLARLDGFKKHFPENQHKIKVYQDWRELLDKEHKNLDTVNVGTPDHMHAPIAMSAMQLGLHAYVQKPLAHDIYEVRRLTEFAREKKLVTQMGIQIHSSPYYRIGVEVIRSGAIGKIKEVHSWSGKRWGDSEPRPEKSDPVPSTFNWDLWLGVCATRPFIAGGYYHPSNWRKRLDFGTGTFGDMGCHIFDPVFDALALSAPVSLRSEGPAPNQWNWACDAVIHYVFPGTQYTEGPTVPITWYDGSARPPKEIQALVEKPAAAAAAASADPKKKASHGRAAAPIPDQGSIFIGTKGAMLLPHIAVPTLFPQKDFQDFQYPKVSGSSHYAQFIDAVLGTGKTSAPFDYSGPLTESVLLGSVATRVPQTTLQWDSAALKFTNHAAADALLRRSYRQGWEVKGLS